MVGFVATKAVKRHRAFQFWMPVISALLNIYLIFDLLVTLVTGESISMLVFGAGNNPVVEKVIDVLPSDPVMFFLVCGLILSLMCMLAFVLIWVAFYSYRSKKMKVEME